MKKTKYGPTARRLARQSGRITWAGVTISPLADPDAFAAKNDLELLIDKVRPLPGGIRRLVAFRRLSDNRKAVISGVVTRTRDDSDTMSADDLDFVWEKDFNVYLYAAHQDFEEGTTQATRAPLLYVA